MKGKRWFFGTISMTLVILAVMAAIMIDIDPYFHYHGPVEGRPYAMYGSGSYEKYYNDGIGKHFKYDAMITGSSVTENFKATQVEILWQCTAVKTCFAGGTLKEVDEHIKRSLAANDGVKMIIRGIDENKLLKEKDGMPKNAPTYLYDKNVFNDVNYLFNKDTWLTPLRRNFQMMKYDYISTNFDQYSNWSMSATFSKERTLDNYARPEKAAQKTELTPELLTQIQGNIEQNVAATVRDNPNVTFYYFLTPSSICQWDEWNQTGVLECQLVAERMLIEELLKYENVRLFGYSDRFDIITNLDNYMDVEHFSDEINDLLIGLMYAGEGRLTKDNYMEYINKISLYYMNYDYESIFTENRQNKAVEQVEGD